MKTDYLLKGMSIAAGTLLMCMSAGAATPTIEVTYIPPLGSNGSVEGKVIWSDLNASNAANYAVIAMLRTEWGDYVKPTYENYLGTIDANGYFRINITTGDNDKNMPNVRLYFVTKSLFSGVSGEAVTTAYMTSGKYLAMHDVNRTDFWNSQPAGPQPSIRPGFVAAGTSISLTTSGGTILYTTDGSDPQTSSTAKTYSTAFKVPAKGSLLIKAVSKHGTTYSDLRTFVYLPQAPLPCANLFGLNVSLALNGEYFGQDITEQETRRRLQSIDSIALWVKTFSTLNNGHPYINKIAKGEKHLNTVIGLYITNNAADNAAQVQGLRRILEMGPEPPDLLVVGNEPSIQNVSFSVIAENITAVRQLLKEMNLVIPIGCIDVYGADWSHTVQTQADWIGFNYYGGTWDATPESQMFSALKTAYDNVLANNPYKFVMITETGTPYSSGTYAVEGGTQTPSISKAANYLRNIVNWTNQEKVPLFYFEAYNEEVKSSNGGHPIEQYFGIMDGNLQIHSFYQDIIKKTCPCRNEEVSSNEDSNYPYPNPTDGMVYLRAESDLKVYNVLGNILIDERSDRFDLAPYPSGVYLLHLPTQTHKLLKK